MTAPAATEGAPFTAVAEQEQPSIVALQQSAPSSASPAPTSVALPPLNLTDQAPGAERHAVVAAGLWTEFASFARSFGSIVLGASLAGPRQSHPAAAPAAARQPAPGSRSGFSLAPGSSSGGGGFSPSFFLAIILALAGLAHLLCERLRLPTVVWRPVAFVSLLERPG
jgi:hypothetical protein